MATKTLNQPDSYTGACLALAHNDNGDGTVTRLVVPQQGAIARVTAGGAAPGQSVKQFSGKIALSTTVTTAVPLYTVTAGKTLLITDIFISHDTSQVVDTRVQAAGVDIFRWPSKGDTAPLVAPSIETPPQASAGQAVQILFPVVGSAANAYYNIFGVEQ